MTSTEGVKRTFSKAPSMSKPPAANEDEVDPKSTNLLPVIVRGFKMASIAIVVWLWGYLGFSIAWIYVALFFHVASEECRKYKESKKSYALQAVLNERAAITARVDDHSSWVYFPDTEKAEWFNKTVKQMWPYIGDYIKEVLKNSVERSIQENLPPNLKSFKFEMIDTGDIPPRVDGVKVYIDPRKNDEIICDIDLRYSGDANIKVAIKGVIAGIKSLVINGTMRVIMKPLTNELPIIGGLSIFFLNKPLVDFNLTAAANLLDMPLISKSIRIIVEDQIANYLVLPNRIPIELGSNIDKNLLKHPLPQGVIKLQIVEAKELKRADTKVFGKGGKSDPYCKIIVGAREMKTKVIQNSINPIWKEQFEAVVDQKHGQFVDLQVFDHDVGTNNDDSLGNASFDIEVLAQNGSIDLWLPLEDVKTGQIYIRSMWMNLSQDIEDLKEAKNHAKNTPSSSNETWSCAVLVVTVDKAQKLPLGLTSKTERNAFVRMTLGKEKQQTKVRMTCNNPIWDENFQFLVKDPESDNLVLEVCHRGKTEKKLGTVNFPVNIVLTSDNMTTSKIFPLAECGPEANLVVRMSLRILTSDFDPRWSDVSSGMKLGRIASIDPLESSRPTGRSIKTRGKGEPSIDLPIMSRKLTDPNPQFEQKTTSTGTMHPSVEPVSKEAEHSGTDGLWDVGAQEMKPPLSESTPVKDRPTSKEITPTRENRFGQIQLTIRYATQRGHLVVVVHKCKNLIPCDKDNLADPYVRLYVLPDPSSATKKKTKMVKNTLSPVFDETFEWPMAQMELPFRTLDVAVKNDVGLFSKSRTDMGRVVIELSKLGDLSQATTTWFDLRDPKSA